MSIEFQPGNANVIAEMLAFLETGLIRTQGYLPWSSNHTFLVDVHGDDQQMVTAVYKPRRGERPLWDFPSGTLCQRERAAFLVSDSLGWHIVPPTILRDGPQGIGSVQLFIEHDPDCHYFTFEGDVQYRDQLQQITLFDMLTNNADRKGGHVLLQVTAANATNIGRLWTIDHGICFHTAYKLRTVIWEFAGQPIPEPLLADLRHFQDNLSQNRHGIRSQLGTLLSPNEMHALSQRLGRIIDEAVFGNPGPGRHYPWPPV